MLPSRVGRTAWWVVAYNLLVILWGAYVRASGSGAGCGSHWPTCNGEVIPTDPSIKTLIEFTHRTTSGLALLSVVYLLWLVFKEAPKGHPSRRGAAASMFFMLTEAGVGAGLVLFEYVAENASMARAMFMGVHLVNTFILLACMALTAWWAGGRPGISVRGGLNAWLLGAACLMLMVLGVSGAITALGDTLFPAGSLEEGMAQDLSPTAHIFLRLRVLHPALALLTAVYLFTVASLVVDGRSHSETRVLARAVMLLVVLQLLAGLTNLLLLAPTWMQLVHLLLADGVWLAVVLLGASALRAEEAPSA